jgi:hypothetical protein
MNRFSLKKMTEIKKMLILFISLMILFISSCKKNENETKISSNGDSESHNMGQNCMSCHVSGEKGEGWF